MSRLLFKGPFIPYFPELAAQLGTLDSLILSVVSYRLYEAANGGENYKNGRYWVSKPIREWQEEYFPKESFNTIKRAFERLENSGLLISEKYNKSEFKHAKWYSIDFNVLDELTSKMDEGDKVWQALRRADLANRLGQNELIDKMGDTEDGYGKFPLEASKTRLGQNELIDKAKMGQSYIYKENKNKNSQASDEIKEEESVAHFVHSDLKLEGAYREEVLAKCKYTEERINRLTQEFIDLHILKKTKRIEWQGFLRTYCLNRYKAEQKSPTRARDIPVEKTPAQELWSKIWKYCKDWKSASEIAGCGFGYLKGAELHGDYFAVEAPESERRYIKVETCRELILDALQRLKNEINNVEFLWR